MPRTRSLAWSELKIGVVAIVALVLASVMIFMLSSSGGFFWQRYSLKTQFQTVAGLKAGAPVRVAGVEVGSVTGTELMGEVVEVTLEVAQEHQPLITTGSKALLGSVSLLGEAAVDITPSRTGTPIPEWGYIPSGRPVGSIAEVATQATEGIEEATGVLRDIRSGRGTIGKLFTDEAIYRDVSALVQQAERVTDQIASGRGTLGRLTTDPRLYNELSASVRDLNAMTARIRSGEGSIGKLLNDPALANSLTTTTQNIESLTGRLNRGEGTAGKLMTDTQLYDRLNQTASRLDALTTALNNGEGTAGQLLKDKQLYENMTKAMNEITGLIAEIRKDPKKYLNVKVSIF
ncbi:MAG TPA: MlaD family protein [Vicinamibacterales bacterium]|nr:MlaD family protein [Vicinamibacterales bacterium]